MFVLQNKPPVQYCPDESHNGDHTRCIWPYQFFEQAVEAWRRASAAPATTTLPDIALEF